MSPDPWSLALFLLVAFTMAGAAQTAWFGSPWSRAFMAPLDGGSTLRGRRIFGPHKTIRGLVGMVPAAAAAFGLLAWLLRDRPGIWPLSVAQYVALGGWAGLGFMAGELPNSFIKRQLGIAAGQAPERPAAVVAQFVADRLDSGIGMLAAISVAVHVPVLTWAYVLLVGPFIHWCFSLLMFRLGIKARPA